MYIMYKLSCLRSLSQCYTNTCTYHSSVYFSAHRDSTGLWFTLPQRHIVHGCDSFFEPHDAFKYPLNFLYQWTGTLFDSFLAFWTLNDAWFELVASSTSVTMGLDICAFVVCYSCGAQLSIQWIPSCGYSMSVVYIGVQMMWGHACAGARVILL